LPDLLKHFSQPRLDFYGDVERGSFLKQVPEADTVMFSRLWEKLRAHVGRSGPLQ